jgi:dTDP-4-dehydrorhamnose 3,5-epimerase
MNVTETSIPGVLLIEPRRFGDSRGFFSELFHEERYAAAGVTGRFVQDNLSRSKKGTLRGLHFQEPRPQGKLVQVLRGAVYDVVVDIRRGSPAFGRWFGVELSDENYRQLWVPPGFAHGFCVLSDVADFYYKCTDLYIPEHDRGILWNDPAIGIDWPIQEPLLSAKDKVAPTLSNAPVLPIWNS